MSAVALSVITKLLISPNGIILYAFPVSIVNIVLLLTLPPLDILQWFFGGKHERATDIKRTSLIDLGSNGIPQERLN